MLSLLHGLRLCHMYSSLAAGGTAVPDCGRQSYSDRCQQHGLQSSMQQVGGGAAPRGRAQQRAPFVPVSERLCYGCKKPGHVLADCPNLSDAEKIAKLKEVNAAKGAGKGKGRS